MALSRSDKQRIAKLREKQRSSLVFGKDGKLNEKEMQQRRRNIERQIAGVQSGGRVSQEPRFKRFGPSVDSRTSTQTNDNFMNQLRLNTGGFPQSPRPRDDTYRNHPKYDPGVLKLDRWDNFLGDTSPIIDRTPIINNNLMTPRYGNENPDSRTSTQTNDNFMNQLRLNTGGFVPNVPELRSRRPATGLLDLLRLNTGGFVPNSRRPAMGLLDLLRLHTGGFASQPSLGSDRTRGIVDSNPGFYKRYGELSGNVNGVGPSADAFTQQNIDLYYNRPPLTDLLPMNDYYNPNDYILPRDKYGVGILPTETDMNWLKYNENNTIKSGAEQTFGFDIYGDGGGNPSFNIPRGGVPGARDMSGVASINQENLNTILNPTYGNFAPTGRFANGGGSFLDSTRNNPQRFDGLSYGDVMPGTSNLPPGVNTIPTVFSGLLGGLNRGFGLF